MCLNEFAASLQEPIAAGSTLRFAGFRSPDCSRELRDNWAFDPLNMRPRLTVAGRRLTSVGVTGLLKATRSPDQVAQLYGGLKASLRTAPSGREGRLRKGKVCLEQRMSLEEHLARAIAEAFWETAEQPRHWAIMGEQHREVFRICARRAIAAGQEYRKRKTPA